jgi:hypothetical protein
MTKAVNVWAIWHPAQGLLLHSLHANKPGAWAMMHMHSRPEEQRSEEQNIALGFRAIQVRVKFDEPG